MRYLLKILAFLNVLDYTGTSISITNLAVIALVSKLVLTNNPDIATVGVTAVSILSYAHKRSINAKAGSDNQESVDTAP